MSKEIQWTDDTGLTEYVNITNAVGQWYNTVGLAFEAFNAANFADYDVAGTEFGATGVYAADMPALALGTYFIVARRRAGVAPAVSDTKVAQGSLDWTGSKVLNANALAAILRRRTQANVEADSDGDALSLSSQYGFIQQAQESEVAAGVLTVNQTDGVTLLGTKVVSSDPAADPIVGIE